jgi:MFS family permease
MPYNYLIANEIRDHVLKSWYGYKTAISNTLQVIIPLIVGFLLMEYTYSEVAIIFIVIQLICLLLACTFTSKNKHTNKYSLTKYNETIKNHNLVRYFRVNHMIEFLTGFAVSNSALGTLITLYVVKMFKTNSNLGIFTSIFMFINVILSYLFAKKAREKDFGKYMTISGVLITFSIILFMINTNKATLIFYNLVYNVGAAMMVLIIQIMNMKVAKYRVIKRNYQLEHLSVREFYLCLGRVVGYILLIIAGLFKEEYLFKILIFIYSISFLLLAAFTLHHLKEEDSL